MDTPISIAARFCGPPNIAHGGYLAGLLSEGLSGAVQVTLKKPSPLDTPLVVRALPDGKRALVQGDVVLAELEPSTLALDVPRPPSLAEARAAELASTVQRSHPRCFGCGQDRPAGDALRLFVGPCEAGGQRQLACPWRPDPSLVEGGHVLRRFVFAALDCPGAMAFIADGKGAGLLGRIVIEQRAPVPATEDLIVTAWQIGAEGRKMFAGTALVRLNARLARRDREKPEDEVRNPPVLLGPPRGLRFSAHGLCPRVRAVRALPQYAVLGGSGMHVEPLSRDAVGGVDEEPHGSRRHG